MSVKIFHTSTSSSSSSDDEEEKKDVIMIPLTRSSSTTTLRSLRKNDSDPINALNDSPLCQCSKTCIHSIAKTGSVKKLTTAISNGADQIWIKDDYGRTALHYSASLGHPQKSASCVKILVEKTYISSKMDDSALEKYVNIQDYEKSTALYLAAKYENKETCEILIKSFSDVTLKSKTGRTALEMIYKHIPDALVFTLDLAMENSFYTDKEKNHLELYIRTVVGHPLIEGEETYPRNGEMSMVSNILHSPLQSRGLFLSHTLIKIFLWLQWKKFSSLFWKIRLFKISWLLSYFLLMIYFYRELCPYAGESKDAFQYSWFYFSPQPVSNITIRGLEECQDVLPTWAKSIAYLLISLTIIVFSLELLESIERIRKREHRVTKILRLKIFKKLKVRQVKRFTLFIFILVTCLPLISSTFILSPQNIHYIIAALGVFFAWILIFFEIGKVPKYRAHIETLTVVMSTFGKVMLTYASILIAFATTFCILLPGIPGFSSLPQALLKMIVLMAGEGEFEDLSYDGESISVKAFSPSLTVSMVFYGLSMTVITVVMLNYLIGLTVRDIQMVRDDAHIWNSSTIISQVYILETFLRKLPFGLE